MSAAPEEPTGLPIGWLVAATRVHEDTFRAVAGDLVIEDLLTLHAPHPPQTSDQRSSGPVCQGCDRPELAPTRAPAWPCTTYALIGRELLGRDVALTYTEIATDDPASPK